jgi:hypothetical protein
LEKELTKIIFSIISLLVTSGCFGYLNYSILEKFDAISYSSNFSDEKKLVILFFSGLNFFLYLWINTYFGTSQKGIVITIGIVLLFDILGTVIIICPLIAFGKFTLNLIRSGLLGKSKIDTRSTRDFVFNSDKYQRVYIFDFDNKLIAAGWLDYQQASSNNYFDISLMPLDEPETDIDFQLITKYASKTESRVLVDFEKQVKLYIIRES